MTLGIGTLLLLFGVLVPAGVAHAQSQSEEKLFLDAIGEFVKMEEWANAKDGVLLIDPRLSPARPQDAELVRNLRSAATHRSGTTPGRRVLAEGDAAVCFENRKTCASGGNSLLRLTRITSNADTVVVNFVTFQYTGGQAGDSVSTIGSKAYSVSGIMYMLKDAKGWRIVRFRLTGMT